MKKFFLFCLIAATAAFVSCSKDEDNADEKAGNIVGKWEVYKAVDLVGSQVESEWNKGDGGSWFIEFRKDGTGVDTEMLDYDNDSWQTEEEHFTYSVNGSSLRLQYVDGWYDIYTIEKLTSSELVISAKDGSYVMRLYLKRL